MSEKYIILRESGEKDGFIISAKGGNLEIRRVENGTADSGAVVTEVCAGDFDAVMDCENRPHIIFADSEGGITYMAKPSGWVKGKMLAARENTSAKIGEMYLFEHGGLLFAVYSVLSGGGNVLCMQYLNGSGETAAIDRLEGDKFFAFERGGEVFVFYNSYTERKAGFKRLSLKNKDWSGFRQLFYSGAASTFFATEADGEIFICCKIGNEIRFCRIECGTENDEVCGELALTRRHTSACSPPLLRCNADGSVSLSWICGNRICSGVGSEGGKRWGRLTEHRYAEETAVFHICDAQNGRRYSEAGRLLGGNPISENGERIFGGKTEIIQNAPTNNKRTQNTRIGKKSEQNVCMKERLAQSTPNAVNFTNSAVHNLPEYRSVAQDMAAYYTSEYNSPKESYSEGLGSICRFSAPNAGKNISAFENGTQVHENRMQISENRAKKQDNGTGLFENRAQTSYIYKTPSQGTHTEANGEPKRLKMYIKFVYRDKKRIISAKQHKKSRKKLSDIRLKF